jgi:hypothetical protein
VAFILTFSIELLGAYHDLRLRLSYPRVFGYQLLGDAVAQGHSDWRYDEFRVSNNGHLLHEIEWWGHEATSRWLIEERLEQVTIAHVESSREAALAAIDGFAAAVNAPDDAGPSNMVCFDCGDPGQKMVDRLWTSAGDTHSLRVFLREGAGTVVINLEWARH